MAVSGPEGEEKREARKIEVLVVDDHQMVRQGLSLLMEGEPDIAMAGEAANGEEAMRRLRERDWDVVLLDITLPDCCGLDLLEDIGRMRPDTRVVVLSMHSTSDYAGEAMARGASGYVAKEDAAAEVVEAIRVVMGGGTYISGTHPRQDRGPR